MYVIEGLHQTMVVDTYVSDTIRSTGDTIRYPLVSHFTETRVMPFGASLFPTVEEAQSELAEAVAEWSHPEYAKWEGLVDGARVAYHNPSCHPYGYMIEGTTDLEVANKHFPTYKEAFKALHALYRKKVKHRGETPNLIWYQPQHSLQLSASPIQ